MSQYIPVVLMLAFGSLVVGVMVSLNRLIGPHAPTAIKSQTFECGNAPAPVSWGRFAVKFYLVAILFIVFDVEVVFMCPWAVIFRELGLFGFIEMLVFIAILTVGFVFAWRKGALEWR